MVLQKKGNTLENPPPKKIEEKLKIGAETTHLYIDKAQTSSSVSNGTIATTGPMDEN